VEIHSINILRSLVALAAGGVIGFGFGAIQQAAQRRYEQRQQNGKLVSGWAVMPGSGRRVAYLLIALAVIQAICPILFVGNTQWWVSAGLVGSYGWGLLQQLRHRLRATPRI
jgi:hypothetical protein